MRTLADIRLYMLDLDGTFYLGDKLLPGAAEFAETARAANAEYLFLTNNSSKSSDAYLEKLARLGIETDARHVLTSGDATLAYMQRHFTTRDLLLIGTPSLCAQFEAGGFRVDAAQPQAVVLGFDTTLTYEKLTKLCDAVRAGLPYIATHPDFNCPVPGGFLPDIGATIAYVKASAGREPDVVIGKPNGSIAEAAAERFGVPLERIAMVGDRLYTDIALGACGVATVLVMSGETTADDLATSAVQPDFVFDDLAHLSAAMPHAGAPASR